MRRLLLCAVLVGLAGCYDPETTDSDRDGVVDAEDCAQDDPGRHPGAADSFGDGVDQDCDGVDGVDADGDGYPGNAPEDDAAYDCDDRDPDMSPRDADGDGWSTCAGDCDDTDSIRHPGAWDSEFDNLDDDCDGADSGTLISATHATFTGRPGEKAGESIAALGDIDGDGLPDVIIGAPFAGDEGSEAGRAYILFGSSLGAGGAIGAESADGTLEGALPGDRFGSWVAAAGDVDGDDLADVLVGAPRSDLNGFASGAVHLFYGSSLVAATGSVLGAADADVIFAAENWGDELSIATSAGDVDDDGLGDILLGAPLNDAGLEDAGRAYLFLGATILAGPPVEKKKGGESEGPCSRLGGFSACDADIIFTGEAIDDFAGTSVGTAGDLDDDGLDDILIGVPGSDLNGATAGLVAVFFGSDVAAILAAGTRTVGLSAASRHLSGDVPGAQVGESIGSGDVDGDGVPDIFAGGCRARTGRQPGPASLHVWAGADVAAGPEPVGPYIRFERAKTDEGFCNAGPAGDVDGDGAVDVLFGDHGALRVDPPGAGTTALFLASGFDAEPRTILDADYGFWGERRDDQSGWTVVGLGDVDVDGVDDLLVSAVRNSDGGENGGKVYLLLSPFRGPSE